MATYKVIQDIEAEDKLVGPLTLRQFIYAGIAAICLYLSFLSATKGAPFMMALLLPIAAFTGFFAFPWGKDQPTEIWALAKLRFMLKPRRRTWDQSGAKELVTVTVPKKIERQLTNGLNQEEVQSRLNALAQTIDSRGWAIKNVNVNLAAIPTPIDISDRLVGASALPQAVSDIDVQASDDILDEAANPVAHNFDQLVNAASAAHRQQLIAQLKQPAGTPVPAAPAAPVTPVAPPPDYWFLHQSPTSVPGQATFVDSSVVMPGSATPPPAAPQAAVPTAEEEALVQKFRTENSSMSAAYGHLKTLKTPQELMAEEAARRAAAAAKPPVTPKDQAAIMNLANNDDLDVATIARQARKANEGNDGEVVISLH